MKKTLSLVAVMVLSVFLLAGCGGQKQTQTAAPGAGGQQPAKAEVITLKMSDYFPVTHLFSTDCAKFFIDKVHEYTQGKVKIEYFPAEQLGKLKDQLNLTSQGVIDLGIAPASFIAGQLPLNTVILLPEWTTATQGSAIYDKLVKGVLMPEFEKYGVRPVFCYTTPQYDVGTVKKPVTKPEDLKGMKLKTSGGLYDKIAQKYGVTPVVVPSPEIYESTQRGIVEGNFLSYVSVKGYRVDELEKYHTLGGSFGGFPELYVINEKKWQSLPKDVQDAIMKAGEEACKHAGEAIDKDQERLAKEFEQKGMKIYRITPEEKQKWMEPLKGIEQEWMNDMEGKGLPGKNVYAEFHKLCQEIVK